MITEDKKYRLEAQACPFCGENQEVLVNGHYPQKDNPEQVYIDPDLGYSFCNCKNIFYTKWPNIKQEVYDDKYVKRYEGGNINRLLRKYVIHYWDFFKDKKSILDIGSINDGILDESADRGLVCWGLDIVERPSKYPMIFGDLEKTEIKDKRKFDIITASHVFEHFKNPIKALEKCYEALNPGGVLFIAMPDPYFIDFKNPYMWGHWHIREHHIMWDMDSWADEMKSIGLKIVLKQRNVDPFFICTGDFHVIGEKCQ